MTALPAIPDVMRRAVVLALAALAAHGEIAPFRTAAESVWIGNLPRLHAYLQEVEGTSLDAPAAPASPPRVPLPRNPAPSVTRRGCCTVMVVGRAN